MWCEDLKPCPLYPCGELGAVLGVGWLRGDQPFSTGAMERSTFDRLAVLAEDPYQPVVTAGVHACDVCQFPEAAGSAHLIVPGDGVLYVCPTLIVHYVAVHRYLPPAAFLAAVTRCPDVRTREYRVAYLDNGGRALSRALKQLGAP